MGFSALAGSLHDSAADKDGCLYQIYSIFWEWHNNAFENESVLILTPLQNTLIILSESYLFILSVVSSRMIKHGVILLHLLCV